MEPFSEDLVHMDEEADSHEASDEEPGHENEPINDGKTFRQLELRSLKETRQMDILLSEIKETKRLTQEQLGYPSPDACKPSVTILLRWRRDLLNVQLPTRSYTKLQSATRFIVDRSPPS